MSPSEAKIIRHVNLRGDTVMTIINLNASVLNVRYHSTRVDLCTNKAFERQSSGKIINNAGDVPSKHAVANKRATQCQLNVLTLLAAV